jgi:hypothetical protein
MTCDGMRPEGLSAELSVSPKMLRKWLRERFPRADGEHGMPWFLTHEQVTAVRQRYGPALDIPRQATHAPGAQRPEGGPARPDLSSNSARDKGGVAGPSTEVVRVLRGIPASISGARRPAPAGGLPEEAGFYAWWTRPGTISGIPETGHPDARLDLVLFYVGIAPNGPTSSSTIRSRVIGNHLAGNVGSSTFRFTLASLLRPTLKLHPIRTKTKVVLAASENHQLTVWMQEYLRLTWAPCGEPWTREPEVIDQMAPPLNLADNRAHLFHATLTAARSDFRRASS